MEGIGLRHNVISIVGAYLIQTLTPPFAFYKMVWKSTPVFEPA